MTVGPHQSGHSASPRVFVSYSHDSDDHRRRVLELAQGLREDGIDAWIDQFVLAPPQGWPRWMVEQIEAADFVILVCTHAYRRRFEGSEALGHGRGVTFEGLVAQQLLYDQDLDFESIVPVTFSEAQLESIPTAVRAATAHVLPHGYQNLRRRLLRQLAVTPAPLGVLATESQGMPAELSLTDRLCLLDEQLEACVVNGENTDAVRLEINELHRQLRNGPQLVAEKVLAARYKLLEEAGEGGFATVWKAYDRQTREIVAVKVLHGQWVKDQSRVKRFERSVRRVGNLQHEAVVRVRGEPGVDDHHHYCVMDWMAGGDLQRAVLERRIPRQTALEAVARALTGLAHAHERGLIHRDVKPANILLDEHNRGCIADFDLTRVMQSTQGTRTGALGSFVYAAPEQLRDASRVDVRADVYSAGMCVLFVLYGRDPPPYVGRVAPQFISNASCTPQLREALEDAVAFEAHDRDIDCAKLAELIRVEGGSSCHTGFQEDERSEALERLLTAVLEAEPKRRRSRIEQAAYSAAASSVYVHLVFAWGFVRIGSESRAWDLIAQAQTLLGTRRHDPVHALAVTKYLESIRTLCQRKRWVSKEITTIAAGTSPEGIDVVKLGLLVGQSPILNPPGLALDVFEAWGNRDVSPQVDPTYDERIKAMIKVLDYDDWQYRHLGIRACDSLITAMEVWDQASLQRAEGYSIKSGFARAIMRNLGWADRQSVELARAQLMAKLERDIGIISDSFSANSHYSCALLLHVEMLVCLVTT